MAFVGFTDILFKIEGGKKDVGDIQYLVTQEFNNNIIRLNGDISALTNKLTHVVSAGKDGYILVAKIIPSGFTVAAVAGLGQNIQSNNSTEAKISTNAVEIDRVTVGMGTRALQISQTQNAGGDGSGYGALTDGLFHAAIGAKALTGQTMEIENTKDNGNCIAQMVILEVDTGTTPAI